MEDLLEGIQGSVRNVRVEIWKFKSKNTSRTGKHRWPNRFLPIIEKAKRTSAPTVGRVEVGVFDP